MSTLAPAKYSSTIAESSAISPGRFRVEAIDLLRGAVMILMALDHTRDFLGIRGVNPTDPAQTTIPLFYTRWFTHFCAPVFFFLMGTGAYLSLRTKSKRQLSRFLFTRGLWLIFLELTIFRCLGLQFNFDYHVTVLNVLWALGWAMIVLSVLVHVPLAWIVAFGLVTIAGHDLLDSIQSSNPIWSILHCPGFLVNRAAHAVLVSYPLIPWIGVTAAGYGLGRIYNWTSQRRKAFLLSVGLVSIALFLILRTLNVYGDPSRWSAQSSTGRTVLLFLNTNKYPPSLLFLLMTLGPALVFLWAFDARTPRLLRPALVFGRVPMFYFLLHIPLIHLIALAVCCARYGHIHWVFESPTVAQIPFAAPPGWGFSLPFVYLMWIGIVFLLYPVCRWFAGVKQRHRNAWLSYL